MEWALTFFAGWLACMIYEGIKRRRGEKE